MLRFLCVLISANIFMMTTANTDASHGKVIMCNIFTKSVLDDIKIGSIDFNLCTHLIVLDKSFRKGKDPWDWFDWMDSPRDNDYEQITNLRKTFPHLNVSLCISHHPAEYLKIASNLRSRRRFITNAFDFLMRYKFDGLHLKWFDTKSASPFEKGVPTGKEMFTLLMKEMKEKFEWNQLLVTSSFVGEKQFLFETFDYPAISKYLDFMQFALHEYDPPLVHFSVEYALKSRSFTDLQDIIVYLIKLGVPSTKILIESVFMGVELDFESRTTTHFTYYQICNKLASNGMNGWKIDFDSEVGLAVAVNRRRSHTILFENSRGIANKMRFAMKHNLAGALVSCVNTDDYLGQCGIEKDIYADYRAETNTTLNIPRRRSNTFPLLNTVNEAILVANNEIEQQMFHKSYDNTTVGKVEDAKNNIVFD